MFLRIIILSAVLVVSTAFRGIRIELSAPPAESNEIRNLRKLLPKECGLKHRRNRIARVAYGSLTNPYDNPWMVALIYENKTSEVLSLRCSGSLITDQYVLTAAHCLTKHVPKELHLAYARLGEWNLTSDVDCTEDGCRPDPIDVPIEEIEETPHELFEINQNPMRVVHDIGLLKLARRVVFTDEVRPICLPETPNIPDYMKVAGWGLNEHMRQSAVLMDASVKYVSLKDCRAIAAKNRMHVSISPDQICARGYGRQDSCGGDSGGPLMSTSEDDDPNSRAVIVGIISLGLTSVCPSLLPAVHTKVYNYIPWILRKINKTSASESGGESEDATVEEETSPVLTNIATIEKKYRYSI